MRVWLLLVAMCAWSLLARGEEEFVSPGRDEGGVIVHDVRCAYQSAATKIRVVVPEGMDRGKRYPVVYVLPVEAREESRYGDGLGEVKRLGLAEKYRAIFVEPTFAQLPWYADHPTDLGVRQESYLLKVVVPAVERLYPARAEAEGRLLLGFSKSGWGAWSLLLRNPEVFGRAAAFDAPMMMGWPGKYGSVPIFGGEENFKAYQVSALLERRAGELRGKGARLILLGEGNFQAEHVRVHELMEKLGVPHVYREGPKREHTWGSGWVGEGVELLFAGGTAR